MLLSCLWQIQRHILYSQSPTQTHGGWGAALPTTPSFPGSFSARPVLSQEHVQATPASSMGARAGPRVRLPSPCSSSLWRGALGSPSGLEETLGSCLFRFAPNPVWGGKKRARERIDQVTDGGVVGESGKGIERKRDRERQRAAEEPRGTHKSSVS